ncbi:MAG: hypothetical protein ACRCYZ_01095 [Alphaproteobacteria bacterium]
MKSIALSFLVTGVTFLTSNGWGVLSDVSEEVRASVDIKFSTAGAEAPLDEKHPAIRAACKIEDPQNRETALQMSQVFRKNLNLVTDWLKNRIEHADNIFSTWEAMTPEGRPILTSGELWKQESVRIEELSTYLKNSWRGFPLVVRNDHHSVVLHIQRDEKQKTTCAHFYDPYEPFGPGSFLEIKSWEGIIDVFGNKVEKFSH